MSFVWLHTNNRDFRLMDAYIIENLLYFFELHILELVIFLL